MRYAITGAAGQISRPLVKQLLKAGHSVTAIGRSEDHLRELITAGAQAAIGAVEDRDFLKAAFADAHAVYTMYPGSFSAPDLKAFIEQIAKNYAEAIQANNIRSSLTSAP